MILILPSRREFERALADHKRLDLYQIADMRLAFDALIEWQVNPRPRNWNSRYGSLQCLPDGLRGPLDVVKKTLYALQKFTRPVPAPYSAEESWQQWGHITL